MTGFSGIYHRVRPSLFTLLGFTVFYILFFSPILFSRKFLAVGDALVYSLPNFFSVKSLWDPFVQTGSPMMADPQVMFWYPLANFFSWVGSWNAFVLSAYVLASSFTCGYCYTITRSYLASITGGLIFGMSGFMMAHLGHTNMIHSAMWLPLLLWSSENLRQHFSWSWFITGCTGVCFAVLASHPQIAAYILVTVALYAMLRGLQEGPKRTGPFAMFLLISGCGLALSAVCLIPSTELVPFTERRTLTYGRFIQYALPLEQLPSLLFPYLFGGGKVWPFHGIPYWGVWNLEEITGYIGLLPLLLSMTAIAISDRKSPKWIWVLLAVLSLLLALGNATPFARLVYFIPLLNKFRAPARHVLEFHFAISALSALGIAAILRSDSAKQAVRKSLIIVFFLLAIFLSFVLWQAEKLRMHAQKAGIQDLEFLPWVNPTVGIPLFIFILSSVSLLLLIHSRFSRFRQALLLFVLVIDLGSFAWFVSWRNAPSQEVIQIPAELERLKGGMRDHRMVSVHGVASPIEGAPAMFPRMWEVPSANGYGPMVLSRVTEVLSMSGAGELQAYWFTANDRGLDMMAVRYVFIATAESVETQGKNVKISNVRLERSVNSQEVLGPKNQLLFIGKDCGADTHSLELEITSPVVAGGVHITGETLCEPVSGSGSLLLNVGGSDGSIHRLKLDRLGAGEFSRSLQVPRIGPVKRIMLQWGGAGGVRIRRINLIDDRSGRTYRFPREISYFADHHKWRKAGSVGSMLVYENLTVLPRVWLVPQVTSMEPRRILRAIRSSRLPDGRRFDPREVALVEEPVNLKSTSDVNARAIVLRSSRTELEIGTSSNAYAFLVLSDAFYPGWKAYIDEEEARIYRTNYAQRGVLLPSGHHIVVFRYEPKSFKIAVAISIFALIVLLTTVISSRFFHRGS